MERLKAPFWQQAILFRLLLPLCIGIVLASCTTKPLLQILATAVLLLCLLLLLFLRNSSRIRSQAALNTLAFAALGFCLHSRERQIPDPRTLLAANNACLCYVEKASPVKNQSQKLELLLLRDSAICFSHTRAILYIQEASTPCRVGDSILAPMRWQRIRNSGIPCSFDIARHYARKQIYLRGYCKSPEISLIGHNQQEENRLLRRISHGAATIIDSHIYEPKTKALLKAMLLGDEQEIDTDTREAYSDTGIIHIISISGAHVALLFALIRAALFWLGGKHQKRYLFLLSSLLIFLYVGMAGAPSSAVRAAAMFFFLQLGMLAEQRNNPLNQLCAAALIMLLFRPVWLFHIGFQLSFAAVTSLMIFYKPLLRLWPTQNTLLIALRNAMAASIAAEILVAPLVAYYFHHFPLLFLPANLIAALGMTLIESMGLALLVLSKVPYLNTLLADSICYLSAGFHELIFLLQELSFDSLKRIYVSLPALISCYLLIIFMSHWLRNGSRSAARHSILCLCMLSILRALHITQQVQQEQLLLWWQHRQANGLLARSFQACLIKGYACAENSVRELLIRQGLSLSVRRQEGLLRIADKRIAVLDSSIQICTPLSADLILLQIPRNKGNPESYLPFLKAKTLVLANMIPAKQVAAWRRECRQRGIYFHYLPADGVFLLPAQ